MQLFFQTDISEHTDQFELNAEESNHSLRVLRQKRGDTLYVTNGKGRLFTCRIEAIAKKRPILSVLAQKAFPPAPFHIHLAIAPVKNQDRMEWLLEKVTEVGVQEVTLLNTEHTEKTFLKMDRLEKKIISACKQSLNTWKPKLNDIRNFKDFVQDESFAHFGKYIAYLDQEHRRHLFRLAKPSGSYIVLIGPEGDFSPEEVRLSLAHQFQPCSLGQSRLRTETAGLVAVHSLNLVQEH